MFKNGCEFSMDDTNYVIFEHMLIYDNRTQIAICCHGWMLKVFQIFQ